MNPMSRPTCELSIVDGQPTIRGEIDLDDRDRLTAWLTEFDDGECEVDMSGVTFLDSSALRAFVIAKRRNSGLRIVNPSPKVAWTLEVTQTDRLLLGVPLSRVGDD